jgi:hypothetical protein
MVTDCPFTVAGAVLIKTTELEEAVVVEVELPQATAITVTRIILIPRNARFRDSICNILLSYEIDDDF